MSRGVRMMRQNRKSIRTRIAALREKDPLILDCESPRRMAFAMRELAREFTKRDREMLDIIAGLVELIDER